MKRKWKRCVLAALITAILVSSTASAAAGFSVKTKGGYWKITIGKFVISNGFTFDELMHRKGKLYIEITTGKVVGKNGAGKENVPRGTQNYIKYPAKYKKGTKMRSLIVYNPENNYTDDVMFIYHMKR